MSLKYVISSKMSLYFMLQEIREEIVQNLWSDKESFVAPSYTLVEEEELCFCECDCDSLDRGFDDLDEGITNNSLEK